MLMLQRVNSDDSCLPEGYLVVVASSIHELRSRHEILKRNGFLNRVRGLLCQKKGGLIQRTRSTLSLSKQRFQNISLDH